MSFRVMLAPHEDPMSYPDYFKELKYPLLASPKFDGIRCVVKNGQLMSRTFKPIPSLQAQKMFGICEHFDGELIEGCPTDPNVYNRTQSYVMSQNKVAEGLKFYAFDYCPNELLKNPFQDRILNLEVRCREIGLPSVIRIPQVFIPNEPTLLDYEEECLIEGYEGLIMKSIDGYYKNGRGTFKQGLIYKLKRFKDDEGYVVGFVEQETNNNEKTVDERGYSKRSSHKENKSAAGTLGKFLVEFSGITIEVPPGILIHSERQEVWNNQEKYLGKILKFRHFPVGVKDRPRFPRFVGWRDKMDM